VKMQKTQRSGLSGSGVSGIRWPLFYFMSVRELLNDKAVTMMLVDNKSLDVSMGLKLDTVNKLNDVNLIIIQAPTGSVKLSDIAEVKEVLGAVSITTSDGRQYANVTANITEKKYWSCFTKSTGKVTVN
jgi:Cu/Ag efflux pump CusA